jgi:Ca2+-binding RTX toxin-like protein
VIVNAVPGQDIVLEAAFDQAEVKMDGGNVIFEFANGGQVVLDFSDIGTAQAPNVVMPDGTILNMEEFLASLGESDVEPAAGPDGGATGSGGVGEYRDDAGNIIDGVDKLGVLDPREFTSVSVEALDADPLVVAEIENPLPTAGIVDAAADEDGMVVRLTEPRTPFKGNKDERDGDHPAQFSYVEGSLSYDFGGDGPAGANPFVWSLNGLAAKGVTSQGNTLLYEVVDGVTLNAYYMGPDNGEETYAKIAVIQDQDVPQVKYLVFTIQVQDIGTGAYRFELYRPLDHTDPSTEDDIVYNFSYTITDGSGDTAVGGVNMIVDDDSPVLAPESSEMKMVNESDLYTWYSQGTDGSWKGGPNTDYVPPHGHASFVSGSLAGLVNFGADGMGSFSFVDGIEGMLEEMGLYSFQGSEKISLQYSTTPPDGDGWVVLKATEPNDIQWKANPVFELRLNQTTGDYEFRLFDELGHDEPDTSPNDESTLKNMEQASGRDQVISLDFGKLIQATDGDGDFVSLAGAFEINIIDDKPFASAKCVTGKLHLDETGGLDAAYLYASGLFYEPKFGADHKAGEVYSLSAVDGAKTGLWLTGQSGEEAEIILVEVTPGTVFEGRSGEDVAFRISINPGTGKIVVEQLMTLEHTWDGKSSAAHDDPLYLSGEAAVRVVQTLTDRDGDVSAATSKYALVIRFDDDGPSVNSDKNKTVWLEDDDLKPHGLDNNSPGDDYAPLNATGTLNHDYGQDGEGSVKLAWIELPKYLGFTSVLENEGLLLTVKQNGVDVLRITLLNETSGQYKVEQLASIKHPRGDEENNVWFKVGYTVTDGDGDWANGDFWIAVDDDMPVVSVKGPGSVYEDGADIAGSWDAKIGADQPGEIKVIVNQKAYDVGQPITVIQNGQTLGVLTVNGDKTWVFDPSPNLDNSKDTSFKFWIRATDADQDVVSESHTINIKDGKDPIGGGKGGLVLDEEALLNENAKGTNPDSDAETGSVKLSFTAGSDDLIKFEFSNYLNGLLRNTDGSVGPELTWVRSTDGQTVTGYFEGTANVAVTLTLSAPGSIANGQTGSVEVIAKLSDNLRHALAEGEQELTLGSIRVYAYDHDGDSAYGTVSLAVIDDVPRLDSVQSINVENVSGETLGNIIGLDFGADGKFATEALKIIGENELAGITEQVSDDGTVLTATFDESGDPDVVFYRVTLNGDGTYTFELVTPQVTKTLEIGGQYFKAGPPVETITAYAGEIKVVFDGLLFDPQNGFAPINQPGVSNDDDLNPNDVGFGVNNGNLNDNQGFIASFDKAVNGMSFDVVRSTGNVNSTTIYWKAYAADGKFDSGSLLVSGLGSAGNTGVRAEINSELDFTSLEIRFDMAESNDGVRIQNYAVIDKIVPDDLELAFKVTATDGDGDSVYREFTVKIEAKEDVEVDGVLVVGSNQADVDDSAYSHVVPISANNDDGPIEGGGGNDILVGDVGGSQGFATPGMNYNIALLVDTSSSMKFGLDGSQNVEYDASRMRLIKDALINFVSQELAGHDGVINVALIGFGTTASLKISVQDLDNSSKLNTLIEHIGQSQATGLVADGATNYQGAFNAAKGWFDSQAQAQAQDAKVYTNITYFLTDGDPTASDNGNNGSGSTTEYRDFADAIPAFQNLASQSKVHAIGIGDGVNENYLRFFDNTDPAGALEKVSFGWANPVMVASFNNGDGWNNANNWSNLGSGSIVRADGKLQIADNTSSGQFIGYSPTLNLESSAKVSFEYFTYNVSRPGASASASLQKFSDGSWATVATMLVPPAGEQDGKSINFVTPSGGDYRLAIAVLSGGAFPATVILDNIRYESEQSVTAHVGEVTIVTAASDLDAALVGGSSGSVLNGAGNDLLYGGEGSDIIFGDVLNTDALAQEKGLDLPAGAGWLVFQELEDNASFNWDRDDTMRYIRENSDDLSLESGRTGGNDVIYGGAGDDLIYGQEGNDSIDGGDGNDILVGGTGNDTLIGGAGDDIIIGGAGDDTMSGGTGQDTFAYAAGDVVDGAVTGDTILDFELGPDGDTLDLAALLSGSSTNSLDYVKITGAFGTDGTATVAVSIDQAGTGSNFDTHVANITVTGVTGGSIDDVIDTMINNNIVI